MKKLHKKSLVLLIALALLLICAVGGTAAFLSVASGPVTNIFTPAKLDTKIIETFKNGTKSEIFVENNGTIDAYVRVGVYGYWAVKDGGGNEKIIAPWNASFSLGADWTKSGDWYYYTKKLAPNGAQTSDLLADDITEAGKPVSYPSAYLVVNVIHQSVQAEPVDAVKDAWGWTPPASAQ